MEIGEAKVVCLYLGARSPYEICEGEVASKLQVHYGIHKARRTESDPVQRKYSTWGEDLVHASDSQVWKSVAQPCEA